MSATTGKLAAAVVAGVCLVGSVTAAPANAYSDSQSTKFDNGARLTANIWASNLGGWKGCHDFKSSAVSTMKPKWIEDDFNAHATGINVSLKGVGASFNGADASAKIKNNRGQKGAYISGRVCAGITAISIRFTSTAKAFAYGNIRTVNASV